MENKPKPGADDAIVPTECSMCTIEETAEERPPQYDPSRISSPTSFAELEYLAHKIAQKKGI
jgi:hypothetical protein